MFSKLFPHTNIFAYRSRIKARRVFTRWAVSIAPQCGAIRIFKRSKSGFCSETPWFFSLKKIGTNPRLFDLSKIKSRAKAGKPLRHKDFAPGFFRFSDMFVHF